jgi:hypothetical protein
MTVSTSAFLKYLINEEISLGLVIENIDAMTDKEFYSEIRSSDFKIISNLVHELFESSYKKGIENIETTIASFKILMAVNDIAQSQIILKDE